MKDAEQLKAKRLERNARNPVWRETFMYVWDNPGKTKTEILDANERIAIRDTVKNAVNTMHYELQIMRVANVKREFYIALRGYEGSGLKYVDGYFADLPASQKFHDLILRTTPIARKNSYRS